MCVFDRDSDGVISAEDVQALESETTKKNLKRWFLYRRLLSFRYLSSFKKNVKTLKTKSAESEQMMCILILVLQSLAATCSGCHLAATCSHLSLKQISTLYFEFFM